MQAKTGAHVHDTLADSAGVHAHALHVVVHLVPPLYHSQPARSDACGCRLF